MLRIPQHSKFVVAVLALLGAVLLACGGDGSGGPTDVNGGGDYFYRFDANGTRVEFTAQPSLLASFAQSGNQRNALITGYDATRNSALQIFSGSAIGNSTFTGYTIDLSVGVLVGVLMHYQDASGTLYQSDGATADRVTITEMTATTLRGTFSGRMRSSGKADLVITNGEFFVKRAN